MEFLNFFKIEPEALMVYATTGFKIGVVFAIVFGVQKAINVLIQLISERKKTPSILISLLKTVLKWPVYIIAAVIILDLIGIKVGNLWTVITATATLIAIGFVAVWSVLSNLLCTLMLVISRPFKIGDQIEIIDPVMTTGVKGQVRNINLLFTSLLEISDDKNQMWRTHIPNNLFFQKIVKCQSSTRHFSLEDQLFKKESLLRTPAQSEPE